MQKCKECDRLYRREKRIKNPKVYRNRDSRYYKAHRDKKLAYHKKWLEKNKIKFIAHGLVRKAMKEGKIERKPCEVCGSLNSDAHHDDYTKPLDIRWLCRTHHARHHAYLAPSELLVK